MMRRASTHAPVGDSPAVGLAHQGDTRQVSPLPLIGYRSVPASFLGVPGGVSARYPTVGTAVLIPRVIMGIPLYPLDTRQRSG